MSHTATCELEGTHDHEPHDHEHGGHGPHDHKHGTHEHGPGEEAGHGHSHGLVDPSIKRSREGVRVVLLSLGILGVTAAAQMAVYVLTGSVALLADLIHNAGDALTAIPLGAAFLLRSELAERRAGLLVVLTIFASALAAGTFAVLRILSPLPPTHLPALGLAGAIGVIGNALAARVRLDGGRRLNSAALLADGQHARSDAFVSVGVVASSIAVALGASVADPIIGLLITVMILNITRESWHTVRGQGHHGHDHHHHHDHDHDHDHGSGHEHHDHGSGDRT